jgi:hypothetical protein
LRALLTTPEGVAGALREAGDPDGRSLEGFVVSDARGAAAVRLEIYANAWFQRILGALEQDFGALAAALGEAGINDLALAYLIAHPPRHASLRHVGDRLADYLASDPRADFFRQRWPWCGDLARFESALLDAFDAEDAPVLTRAQLAALPPEQWASLVLRVQPCVRVLSLQWDVTPMTETQEAPRAPAPSRVLVWRRDEAVRWRALEPFEAELFERARAGARFEDLCDAVAERAGEDAAAAEAASTLGRWVDAGLLVAG